MNNEISEKIKKETEELNAVVNRIFSTDDGVYLARRMIKASRMFRTDNKTLSDSELRYYSAWQDFVNLFLTNRLKNEILLKIFKENEENDR